MEIIPSTMKAPGDVRPGIWRGRVLQIKITNVCNLDCAHCTAAVGIAKAQKAMWFMTVDNFRKAVESLAGFPGVIGLFGGNPCLHPQFEKICAIFREVIQDKDQRGLWSNDLHGKVEVCRDTFSPKHSNLNVHRVQKAYDEIADGWPEAISSRKEFMESGLKQPSMHGSWWIALQDFVHDKSERDELIGKCFVNQTWSAEITQIDGVLKAFFCEFAATRGEFHKVLGEPDVGMDVAPGWWSLPMDQFASQVLHHCHRCGACLNPKKIEDRTRAEEQFSATNAALFEKRGGILVTDSAELGNEGPATGYLKPALRQRDRKHP